MSQTTLSSFSLNLPVEGPLTREAFFALHPPAAGLAAVRRMALGTAQCWRAIETNCLPEAIDMLQQAWADGFLLTDCAPLYGDAEKVVGAALMNWQGPDPVLATKCGLERGRAVVDFSRQFIGNLLLRSEQRFGRPVNLLSVHEPQNCRPDAEAECLDTLQALRDEGRIAAIGMGGGGFGQQQRWLGKKVVDYVMTFQRINAVTLQGVSDLVPLCRRMKVRIWAASPFEMGLLGSGYEQYVQQLSTASADQNLIGVRQIATGQLVRQERIIIQRAQHVAAIAVEAGMTLSHIALRFLLSMPQVDYVVVGPSGLGQWNDCVSAYRAGPLPTDLYKRIWQVAQTGDELLRGG